MSVRHVKGAASQKGGAAAKVDVEKLVAEMRKHNPAALRQAAATHLRALAKRQLDDKKGQQNAQAVLALLDQGLLPGGPGAEPLEIESGLPRKGAPPSRKGWGS